MEQLDSAQKPEDYAYEGPKPLDFSNPVGCPCAHTKKDLRTYLLCSLVMELYTYVYAVYFAMLDGLMFTLYRMNGRFLWMVCIT